MWFLLDGDVPTRSLLHFQQLHTPTGRGEHLIDFQTRDCGLHVVPSSFRNSLAADPGSSPEQMMMIIYCFPELLTLRGYEEKEQKNSFTIRINNES